ncbi:MAG TPA: hypothetical protein VHX14_15495 [Thermoanaerobaculia bacterium]|jgi:hypothetical protein|nr:hypothetical protein [Thermoanaerobaculia bacterium]
MKKATRVFLPALALATLFLVPTLFGQSASGAIHIVTDDGTRNIEFNAKLGSGGTPSGEIKFTGPLSVPDQDVDGDGTGDPSAESSTLSLRVEIDCLKIDGNRAVLAGLVKESNVGAYIGRRMLLTVEDGGEGTNAPPDRYTWGQYRSTAATWVASDAELEFDSGAGLTWTATDFERDDDAGIPSNRPAGTDCKTFSLSSYALEEVPQGSGNVQVRP